MKQRMGLMVVGVILVLGGQAWGKFMMPQEVPVERLITNVTAYVKEHPKEAQGYYTLGRINYLALSLKSKTIRAYENNGVANLPGVPNFFQQAGNQAPSEEELKGYLAAAAENFTKAIEMRPDNGLYHLGLASLMDAAVNSGQELGVVPGAKKGEKAANGKEAWRAAAIEEYAKAFDLAIEKDAQITERPIHGLKELVSYDAANGYVNLIKDHPTAAQTEKSEAMQKRIKPLEKLSGPITPIIFSLAAAGQLNELLDPGHVVKFDLDGTGRGQAWPWVKPTTSILVWDPKSTGRIESGKQLFGSVTWWIFWRDGYAALDALDDNRDGKLSGDELKGLAIWTDRNGNGVSDPGEVVSLESAGVVGIEARATGMDGKSPMNSIGLRMKDGRLLTTWDWVVLPAGAK
jgi:hypothetical protein